MRMWFKLVVFVFVLTCFNSCVSIRYIPVDVIYPAQATLPAGVNNIVVASMVKGVNILSGDDYYNRNFDSLLCYYVTKYTGEALNESPRYNASYSNIELAENVSQNTVEEQLDNNNADALIVPVQITLNDSMQIWQYFDGMGYYTRADFLILVQSTWNFYFADLEKVYRKVFSDTLIFSEVSDYNVFKTLLNDREGGEWLSHKIADAHHRTIARYISPQWVSEKRMYYSGGYTELKHADNYIAMGEWNKAAQIWETYSASKSKRLASVCAYNMAVVNESDNNIDSALVWINKSYSIINAMQTLNYKQQLEERKKQIEQLDKQFGK